MEFFVDLRMCFESRSRHNTLHWSRSTLLWRIFLSMCFSVGAKHCNCISNLEFHYRLYFNWVSWGDHFWSPQTSNRLIGCSKARLSISVAVQHGSGWTPASHSQLEDIRVRQQCYRRVPFLVPFTSRGASQESTVQ